MDKSAMLVGFIRVSFCEGVTSHPPTASRRAPPSLHERGKGLRPPDYFAADGCPAGAKAAPKKSPFFQTGRAGVLASSRAIS